MKALALVALAACVDTAPAYTCAHDSDCVRGDIVAPGRCEPETHHCSFGDSQCGPAGFRYHDDAGDASDTCVVHLDAPLSQTNPSVVPLSAQRVRN